jgi:membrane associated rhomboid family serine protease
MKYLFILSFALVYIFFGLNIGYTATSPTWTHITYMFQHAGIFHLAINSFSFFIFFKILERFIAPVKIAVLVVLVAFFVSFACSYSQVVVGASGMIYTMLGAYLFLLFTGKMKFRNKYAIYVFLLSTLTFITLGFVRHNSAGELHLLCLCSGSIISGIYGLIYFKQK